MKLKKVFFLLAALGCFTLSLAACDCSGGGGGLAKTPQEEYERIYSLAGSGVAFRFDEQPTFSIDSKGTFSGGNIVSSINMSSLYTHDYRDESAMKSYSYSKSVNSVSPGANGMEPYYDEQETAFQLSPQEKACRYMTSFRAQTDGVWSYPSTFGNGNYSDLFTSDSFRYSADRLVRKNAELFSPEKLENFSGEKNGGVYYVSAGVKADRIEEFAQWLDAFYPLFYLKDALNADREWKFFDLHSDDTQYGGTVEIKTSARRLEEVIITFATHGDDRSDFGDFTFTARTTFKSGGVSVPAMSALAQS